MAVSVGPTPHGAAIVAEGLKSSVIDEIVLFFTDTDDWGSKMVGRVFLIIVGSKMVGCLDDVDVLPYHEPMLIQHPQDPAMAQTQLFAVCCLQLIHGGQWARIRGSR